MPNRRKGILRLIPIKAFSRNEKYPFRDILGSSRARVTFINILVTMLQKLNQTLGFTPTEGRVVVFLVLSFAVGFGIKLVKDTTTSQPVFDYAAADSEFVARLAAVDTSMGNEDETADEQTKPPSSGKQRLSGRIDINTATKQELISLPGIGEAMAERIIHYREDNGKFTSLNDLVKVKGIGKKKLEQITPFCTVKQ